MTYSYKVTLKKDNEKQIFNFSYVEMSDLFYKIGLENGKLVFNEIKDNFLLNLIINELDLIKDFKTFEFNFIFKDINENHLVIECNNYKKFNDLKRTLRQFNFNYYKSLENPKNFLKYVLSLEVFENLKENERFNNFLNNNFDLKNYKHILNFIKLNE